MLGTRRSTRAALALICFLSGAASTAAQAAQAAQARPTDRGEPGGFPSRVLITNDNGIDDPKLVALAGAFSRRAETWVVAPSTDRSGSGSHLSLILSGGLSLERRELGPGIEAFAVDGYPADCVVLALLGLMKSAPPDLVVSGINGGANLGADWFGSGTVGAARIATLAGIPAIAISGLDDDLPGALDAAVEWVVRLAASDLVRDLESLQYVTVSLPRTEPGAILGVRVTDRAPLQRVPRLEAESPTRWRVVGADEVGVPPPEDSDQAAWERGYIAVVPMRADEVDLERLARWRRDPAVLPAWRAGEAAAAPAAVPDPF